MDPLLNHDAVGLKLGTYGSVVIDSTQEAVIQAPLYEISDEWRTVYSFALNQNAAMRFYGDNLIARGDNGCVYNFEADLQECTQQCLVFFSPGDSWILINPPNSETKIVRAVWQYDRPIIEGIVLHAGEQVTLLAKPGHRYRVTVLDPSLGADVFTDMDRDDDEVDPEVHFGTDVTVNTVVQPNTRHVFVIAQSQEAIAGELVPLTIIRIETNANIDE